MSFRVIFEDWSAKFNLCIEHIQKIVIIELTVQEEQNKKQETIGYDRNQYLKA